MCHTLRLAVIVSLQSLRLDAAWIFLILMIGYPCSACFARQTEVAGEGWASMTPLISPVRLRTVLAEAL
jgi:hypothetical protein